MAMLHQIKQAVKQITEGRSSQWPRLRNAVVAEVKVCEACGSPKLLEAHHIVPFSVDPRLELIRANLVVLCEGAMKCHFVFGHFGNWKCYNPTVIRDVAAFLEKVKASRLSLVRTV